MRVLVLQTDIPDNATADDLDSLHAANAVSAALASRGHEVSRAVFAPDEAKLRGSIAEHAPDAVFNLVETVDGRGEFAPLAPRLLRKLGVPFTGTTADAMDHTNDKPLSKSRLREAGLPTPDWCEPPAWHGLQDDATYIVKSALEDASLGLDDAAVLRGADAVRQRAEDCARRYGGRWFAESFVEGREFNISVLEEDGGPRALPLAEMVFEDWPDNRPKIVGYDAKWADDSFEARKTVRRFGLEQSEPALAAQLIELTHQSWSLFNLSGYARVDFRVASDGSPFILEVNANPGIAPDAGLAAAAAQGGMTYADLIAHILTQAKTH